ncbi:copper chaperone PCu(A)C [Demequina sp. NBRC 110053]|uniref:copper chaperone PCu(A)C n=1 Tax=Demequina sp. NBRC 110053 TaxID=1570342 RepID=UPI0009FE81DE|nr:copper chaperone PCu(A)C [Demequina sp. NBRC 110053]
MLHTTTRLGALAALTVAALTGCASASDDAAGDSGEITITDPWVKAVDEGMTAAFGELTNGTDQAIVLVAASTDASPMIELHETVTGDDGAAMMQQKEAGFTIEPGESLLMEPGGNHIMLMGVEEPIEVGAEVDFTLSFEDGETFEFTAVAKEFSGANEEYEGDHGDMDHGDMDHGDDAEGHGDHEGHDH